MPVNAPNDILDIDAPSFNLLNIDNNLVSLDEARGKNGTVIAFICNHCPYVKAIANRLSKDADELLSESINTIAIMSNDIINYPEDSFENMKIFSKKYKFNFPYLFDETQEIAKKYNAVCTPDFFGFDKNLKLKYRGRLDSSSPGNSEEINGKDLRNAIESTLKNKEVDINQFPSMGCNIKWK